VTVTSTRTDIDVLARIGEALADGTRRRILLTLLTGSAYPADLADDLDCSRPNISNHLACLRGCGLVVATPEGRRARYELADPRLADVRQDVQAFIQSQTGRALLELGTDHRRHELPFQLALPAGESRAVLHGQLDLLVWDEGGPLVIDFKHARSGGPGFEAYQIQLQAYALAVERLCEVDGDIRTRLAFLKERGPPRELTVTAAMRRELENDVARVTEILAAHRGLQKTWPGQARAACEQLGCGFLFRCHGHRGEGGDEIR
jgi:DNA-binding transcriptional ArsR family regulator